MKCRRVENRYLRFLGAGIFIVFCMVIAGTNGYAKDLSVTGEAQATNDKEQVASSDAQKTDEDLKAKDSEEETPTGDNPPVKASDTKKKKQSSVDYLFEDTVVTAQKREQEILEVPMAITAVSDLEIKNRGALNLFELKASVPSLTINRTGELAAIRSISPPGAALPTTGRYVDEMTVNTENAGKGLKFPMVDIARVEVLRGPQGTLYGEGSIGGTIRYITKGPKPGETDGVVEFSVRSQQEGNEGYRTTVAGNLPIPSDTFGVRLVVHNEQSPGWIDNPFWGKDANAQEGWLVRGKSRWEPTESFSAELMHQHYSDKRDIYGFANKDYESNDYTIKPMEQEYDITNLVLNLDLGPVSITSSTGYQDRFQTQDIDIGAYLAIVETFFPGTTVYAPLFGRPFSVANPISNIAYPQDSDIEIFSQEIRLAGALNENFQYTVGAFYKDSSSYQTGGTVYYPDPTAVPVAALSGTTDRRTESLALFCEGTYTFLEKLEATLGLRYYDDTRETDTVSNALTGASGIVDEMDNNATVGRAVLKYRFNDNLMVYASVAEGFRSGGFQRYTIPGSPKNYGPEEIISYEIGTKGAMADGRLVFDADVFFTQYEDIQLSFPIGPVGLPIVSNEGEAEVLGFETSLRWKALDNLMLSLNYSYNDSEYTKPGLSHLEGDPMDNVPDNQFSIAADYHYRWSDTVDSHFHVDYYYVGETEMHMRNFTTFPINSFVGDAVSDLNIRHGWDFGDWSLYLFVENLLEGDAEPTKPILTQNEGTFQRPRLWGAEFRLKF